MKDSSGSYSNYTQIATKVNNFFANVGPSLANIISPTQITHRKFLTGHYAKRFYLNPTSPSEVTNIVHSLKNSKCEGFDGLCISPIKENIDLIAAPFSLICNLSFSLGVFPDKLLPIFNCADSSLFSNYKPISILPCFSKVFEKLFYLSDCLVFLKNLTFLVINMASDHIILQLWLFVGPIPLAWLTSYVDNSMLL